MAENPHSTLSEKRKTPRNFIHILGKEIKIDLFFQILVILFYSSYISFPIYPQVKLFSLVFLFSFLTLVFILLIIRKNEVLRISEFHVLRIQKTGELLKKINEIFNKLPIIIYSLIAILFIGIVSFAISSSIVNKEFYLDNLWVLFIPILGISSWENKINSTRCYFILLFASLVSVVIIENFITNNNWIYDNLSLNQIEYYYRQFSFLSFFSFVLHFLLRKLYLGNVYSSVLSKLTLQLKSHPDLTKSFVYNTLLNQKPDEYLSKIARLIGENLNYKNVYFILPDTRKSSLVLKGIYNENKLSITTKLWEIDSTKSITGWVFNNRKPHLCPDTSNCKIYRPSDNIRCASELSVPINVQSNCIGIIDIQSEYKFAFTNNDVEILTLIADSIALAILQDYETIEKTLVAYELMQETAKIFSSTQTLDNTLRMIAEITKQKFNVDLVILFKHGIGTMIPFPELIISGEKKHPKMLGNAISDKHILYNLTKTKKRLYFSADAQNDNILFGIESKKEFKNFKKTNEFLRSFIKREGIKSSIYLSLGFEKDVVGSLFLNFRSKRRFSEIDINRIEAFGSVLSLGLTIKRKLELLNGPMAGHSAISHSRTQASIELLKSKIDDINNNVSNSEQKKIFKNIYESFDAFHEDWIRLSLFQESLAENINIFSKLISRLQWIAVTYYDGVIIRDNHIDKGADYLNLELKKLIFNIIAESTANALYHGKAKIIEVSLIRKSSDLILEISNNGRAIIEENQRLLSSKKTPKDQKMTGITALLRESRKWFGSENQVFVDSKGKTIIKVIFPMLLWREL